MAPHSSTLAWKIPWAEEPGRLQSMGSLRVRQTEQLHFLFSPSCIGEGNGNPLLSCLENPRDGGAWWAAIYGVAQSRTRLNRLSSSSSSMHKNRLSLVFRRLLVAIVRIKFSRSERKFSDEDSWTYKTDHILLMFPKQVNVLNNMQIHETGKLFQICFNGLIYKDPKSVSVK